MTTPMLWKCWLHVTDCTRNQEQTRKNEPTCTGKAASLLADGFTHTTDYWVTNDAAKWHLGKNLIMKSSWI